VFFIVLFFSFFFAPVIRSVINSVKQSQVTETLALTGLPQT